MAFYQLDPTHPDLARPLLSPLEGPPFLKVGFLSPVRLRLD